LKPKTETGGKTLKYNWYDYRYCLWDDNVYSKFKNADVKSDL